MEIVYIDLFSGVGGFAEGFKQAGMKIDHHYFSEIDKYAIAVYKYKFKEAKYVGSVVAVCGTDIRKKHPNAKFIVTFGFPCQDFSVAGKGKGFDGQRSILFFEAIRIVKEIVPEVFIFENVKGLLTHNKGETFEIVLRTVTDLGLYECEWQLVNTRWILPQNRERVYFVGHLAGQSKPGVFPFRESDSVFRKRTVKRSGQDTYSTTITKNYHKGVHNQGETYIIQKTGGYCDSSPHKINNIRRLTEIECERLQGFPDNWTALGDFDGEIKPISRTQRYKQMGNAVTVDCPRLIAERLNF